MNDRFELPVADPQARQQAVVWLWLGLGALILSGLFAVLIVLARTPGLQDWVPFVDFFRTALVVHVDLSVLVWFAAFAGVLWSLNARGGRRLGWAGAGLSAAGAALMSAAPFLGPGDPLMSNYVPVLRQPLFLGALVVFGLGFGAVVLRALLYPARVGLRISGEGALRFGLNTAAVGAAVALLAFAWSYVAMPDSVQGQGYYELLFWGGGHVLQFTHTHLMLVAWLWLASATGATPRIGPRAVVFLFAWGLLAVFATPLIYLAYPIDSPGHRLLFTWQMEFGGSLASVFIALAVVLGLWRAPWRAQRPERAALVASLALFGSGGLIGFLIQGSDVTVPAHYHGCIVGITLAFMGMSYHLLPRLGFEPVRRRLGVWQAYVYGAGQLLHIAGLAWSGGYGVQRKVAGTAQALDTAERVIAMGLMGLGGLIAILGGVLFLVLVLHAMLRGRALRAPAVLPAGAARKAGLS